MVVHVESVHSDYTSMAMNIEITLHITISLMRWCIRYIQVIQRRVPYYFVKKAVLLLTNYHFELYSVCEVMFNGSLIWNERTLIDSLHHSMFQSNSWHQLIPIVFCFIEIWRHIKCEISWCCLWRIIINIRLILLETIFDWQSKPFTVSIRLNWSIMNLVNVR